MPEKGLYLKLLFEKHSWPSKWLGQTNIDKQREIDNVKEKQSLDISID